MNKFVFNLEWMLRGLGILAEPKPVMTISYQKDENRIECTSWGGERIIALSGEFCDGLFDEIKKWCGERTTIYIWSSSQNRHLAYNEPVENYLTWPALLKKGQGFGTVIGVKYQLRIGDRCRLRCKACGQYLPEENSK